MSYDMMLCDIEALRECNVKLKEIEEKSDTIMKDMGKAIYTLVEYDWRGEESINFEKEFVELKSCYRKFCESRFALRERIADFQIEVKDFDDEYSNKFSSV